MLKYMTKKEFIKAVDERRFVAQGVKGNKFEVFMITNQEYDGRTQYGISRVINPDSKDGTFTQNGGGYNKYHACIEDIAYYVNTHAEDKDEVDVNCVNYFMKTQRMNDI